MVTRFRVRSNRPPERLNLHVSSISPLPKSSPDAFNDPNWQNAMCDECNTLIKNNTWTLGVSIVRCLWLFRHKYLAYGTLSRYKSRLVANGSAQLEDELSLDHSKEMEGHVDGRVIIQQDFDILETELQEARAQIAKLQRKQLGHNNKISLACFRISTLEITFKDIQARHQMAPKRTSTSAAPAMNQPTIRQLYDNCVTAALKAQAANMANVDITNRNLKPREALIARTYSKKMIEAFIEGLPRSIEGNVIALKPETLEEAINISQRLMD
nr:ribonuclease H-like domain-containing protein [Tanacetum cinerariifolium]